MIFEGFQWRKQQVHTTFVNLQSTLIWQGVNHDFWRRACQRRRVRFIRTLFTIAQVSNLLICRTNGKDCEFCFLVSASTGKLQLKLGKKQPGTTTSNWRRGWTTNDQEGWSFCVSQVLSFSVPNFLGFYGEQQALMSSWMLLKRLESKKLLHMKNFMIRKTQQISSNALWNLL